MIIISINYDLSDCKNFRDEKYGFQLCANLTDTQAVDEIIQHKYKIQFEVGIGCIGLMFNMLLHVKRYYYTLVYIVFVLVTCCLLQKLEHTFSYFACVFKNSFLFLISVQAL